MAKAALAETAGCDLSEWHLEEAILCQMRGHPVRVKRAAKRAIAAYDDKGTQQHAACLETSSVVVELAIDMLKSISFLGPGPEKLEKLGKLCDHYSRQYDPHSPLALAARHPPTPWGGVSDSRSALEVAERDARTWLGEQHPHRLRALYALSLAVGWQEDHKAELALAEQAYEWHCWILGVLASADGVRPPLCAR